MLDANWWEFMAADSSDWLVQPVVSLPGITCGWTEQRAGSSESTAAAGSDRDCIANEPVRGNAPIK